MKKTVTFRFWVVKLELEKPSFKITIPAYCTNGAPFVIIVVGSGGVSPYRLEYLSLCEVTLQKHV